MNQNKIMTYSIEENNQDTIYYSIPENTIETEIHMLFRSDELSVNKMQYSANALSTDERKATVILSPITKADIEDAVQNYQKEKVDKIVEKINTSNVKVMAELKKRNIKFESKVDIIAETEAEQKFGTWLKVQYPGYYESHLITSYVPQNDNIGGGPTYQGNGLTETKSNAKKLTLVPPKHGKNSGFVSWYGIVLTLILALALGYSIAYVIWNYLR